MLTDAIKRHPISSFFLLAYLGSWVGWSPWWLSQSGLGVLPYELPLTAIAGINQVGLFLGPFAAAFLVARLVDGRTGARQLWRRLWQWRTGFLPYALALVILPLAASIGYLTGSSLTVDGGAMALISTLAVTYLTYLFGGPFQEEIGWRGFALPRLQQMMGPLGASLIIGVVHCFWHAPLFFTAEWDTPRDRPDQLLSYLFMVLSLSFILTWITNASSGSVLFAMLGHNGLNWTLFAAGTVTGGEVSNTWPATIGLSILALVAVAITRGRLGLRATPGDRTQGSRS